jgi:hypothetical protein
MATNRQTIDDAAAFIQSIKDFQTPERAKKFANQTNSSKQTESTPSNQSFTPKISFEISKNEKAFWPQLKLTDFRREAITFVETHYFKYKSLPAISDFKQAFSETLLPKSPKAWDDFLLSIQDALTNRGIPSYETPQDYLEPNFVLAVNLICNPYDRRSPAAKLKEAGLTTKQWTGFLRITHYQQYYRTRLDDIFNEDMQNEAKLALARMIQAGDLQAIKHYHELQNIYRPNNTNQIFVVLQAIMEVLATHVSSEILSRVATELQATEIIRNAIPSKVS